MNLMAGLDDELCDDSDFRKTGDGSRSGEGFNFLALAEDWLAAQEALQSYEEDREEEIRALRRQWDQGTLEVDVEALVDKLLGLPSPYYGQQKRPNRPAT